MTHYSSKTFIKTITDAMPCMIAYWDRDLLCRFANSAYLEWFGRKPETLLGQSMLALMGERLFAMNEPYIRGALAGQRQDFARTLTKPDGTLGHTWANYIPEFDGGGAVSGFFVLVSDVTQLREAEQRVHESEARYRMLADNSSDIVFELDHDLVRRYVSPACRELLGYEPEEMIGIKPVSMAHPDDAARLALVFQALMDGSLNRHSIVNRIRHRNGKWIWVEAQLRAVKDAETGQTTSIVGALRDITARKAAEDDLAVANSRLRLLAEQDGLTGLANRRAFDEALAKEHLRARREKKALALVMIDVDRFKSFNDTYGHHAGDDCLRRVGGAIAAAISRSGDVAARYGGEEFAVLLPNTDEDGAEVIADKISRAIRGLGIPHVANAHEVVTVSAGVACIDCISVTSDTLVQNADKALYRAKDFGRNAVIRATEVTVKDKVA